MRSLQQLRYHGFDTLGKFFGIGQPGVTIIIDAGFNTFSQNVLGAMASMADSAVLKRLIFESHVMVLLPTGQQPRR